MEGGGLDSSFDSKDDRELYARLMSERQRIQRQYEERRKQRAVRVKQAKPALSLEERERGFQLYISGANEERASEEARRLRRANQRVAGAGPSGAGVPDAASQWQVGTVELKGKDGLLYRSSPHESGEGGQRPRASSPPIEEEYCEDGFEDAEAAAAENDRGEISEELPEEDAQAGEGDGAWLQSRPGTGASVSSIDQDTRGVLRMMHTANKEQLMTLRACLTNQIAGGARPATGSGSASPARVVRQPGRSSNALRPPSGGERPHSGGERPPSGGGGERSLPPSSSSAILTAIQAENARVRRLAEGGGEGVDAEPSSSRPSSRPSSKAGRRLPLSAEAAAECAPPSALGASAGAPAARRVASPSASSSMMWPPSGSSMAAAAAYPASGGTSSSSRAGPPLAPDPGVGSRAEAAPLGFGPPPLAPGWGAAATPAVGSTAAARPAVGTEIVDRVTRLDKRKQKALLRVLEALEAESPDGKGGSRRGDSPSPRPPEEREGAKDSALSVRVVSNWGDPRQCGLSSLEALNSAGEVLRVPRASLSLRGTQTGSSTLPRVLEGAPGATSEKLMFLATVCPRAGGGFDPFEIVVSWPPSLPPPAALRLWNFNSPDGLDKGANHIEVCRGGRAVWSGQVPRGTGGSDLAPALAPLEPGFCAGHSGAQAASEAAACTSVSPSGDRPIWLGEASAPTRAAEDEDAAGEDEPLGPLGGAQRRSANARSREGEPREDTLEQSFRALEKFRSSQSRRFFSDGGLAPAQSPEGDQDADSPRPLQEELQGLGLDVPIREFDDRDVVDGLCNDEPFEHLPTLGSSLVNFNPNESQSVVIPTLPRGRTLVLNCVSTWGDASFVGLAGIEIFDARGFPVVLKDVHRQVSAEPHSINSLPEYESDPRTPDKLFDQVNLTRDDLHVWLAPFTPGQPHAITVDLERQMGISMIRVWNYNKSRLHSSRGVRDMEILLDGQPVFVGEIRRAPGVLTIPEEACEHILFTQEEALLEAIEEHDWLPAHLPVEDDDDVDLPQLAGGFMQDAKVGSRATASRPGTAESRAPAKTGADGRPLTRASDRQLPRGTLCESLTLVLHSTWGDPYYAGLTAMEVLDACLVPIALEAANLAASPSDLNDLEGVEGDPRTVDKLLDGTNCTTDDLHMWLTPFVKSEASVVSDSSEAAVTRNLIRIDLGSKREVAGFHIWNYNKNPEDTCRGVKEFSVYCDDRYIATFLCRKAPGHVNFDFKQVVLLDQPPGDTAARRSNAPPLAPRMPSRGRRESKPSAGRERSSSRHREERPRSGTGTQRGASPAPTAPSPSGRSAAEPGARVLQQYETPLHPCGFVFKLLFLSTWADAHYVGLDGVELYDLEGRPLRPRRVHSNHGSVRNLPGMENDVRTEEALLHGAPGSSGRMWLAPLARQPPNSVELVFDEPTHVSAVHFWNYSRTPARGVRDVEIYVDDLLIYQGIMRQEAGKAGGKRVGEAVLFTTLPEVVERERTSVYLPSAEELVVFFDDRGRVGQGAGCLDESAERPMTALTRLP